MRILLVDDDPFSRFVLSRELKVLGYEPSAVSSAGEALDALGQGFPVVITDWMMTGLSGPDLVRRIRSAEARDLALGMGRRYVYLILLTARSDRSSMLEGLDAGADDFIVKPYDREQLLARLRVAERILSLREDVRQLSGLLPICAYCKRVRESAPNDSGREPGAPAAWVPVETYVSHRSGAAFSHGICPECYASRVRPQLRESGKKG